MKNTKRTLSPNQYRSLFHLETLYFLFGVKVIMCDRENRLRLVVMGGPCTGKSSIIKRFLFGSFDEVHQPTVEDLFQRDFEIGGNTLKVDFLDTAGDVEFPAMRRYFGICYLNLKSDDNSKLFKTQAFDFICSRISTGV